MKSSFLKEMMGTSSSVYSFAGVKDLCNSGRLLEQQSVCETRVSCRAIQVYTVSNSPLFNYYRCAYVTRSQV
jgi:hypothetical protein